MRLMRAVSIASPMVRWEPAFNRLVAQSASLSIASPSDDRSSSLMTPPLELPLSSAATASHRSLGRADAPSLAALDSSCPIARLGAPLPATGTRITYNTRGCLGRTSRRPMSIFPSLSVSSPPNPVYMWPYPIEYHSATELEARPSLVYVDPPESEGGAAVVDARAKAAYIAQAPARAAAQRRSFGLGSDLSTEVVNGTEATGASEGAEARARSRLPGEWRGTGAALLAQRQREEEDLDELSRLAVRVVYADADIIVVDKPAGLLSVPGVYTRFSVVTAAAHVFGLERTDQMIVHRLDESTSGVLVLARNPEAQRNLYKQFRGRSTRKRYTAIVEGSLPANEGEVDWPLSRHPDGPSPWQCVRPLGGKPSLTEYHVLERLPSPYKDCSSMPIKGRDRNSQVAVGSSVGSEVGWSQEAIARAEAEASAKGARVRPRTRTRVSLVPVSGRSHQLRVHMAALGCPIVGDDLYGLQDPEPLREEQLDVVEAGTTGAAVLGDDSSQTGARVGRTVGQRDSAGSNSEPAESSALPPQSRLLLHATSIMFLHPTTGAQMSFEAECPF